MSAMISQLRRAKIICETCQGWGIVSKRHGPDECPRCKGKGWVRP